MSAFAITKPFFHKDKFCHFVFDIHIMIMCSVNTELIFLENKISVGSVTYAIKGRDILKNNGFKVKIERKPSKSLSGCGYSLVFSGSLEKAGEILDRYGVKFKVIE